MHQLNLNAQKTKHFTTNASPSRIDRISSLPDDILNHIMSFLYTKCVARTSVLSKRFNAFWWSFPAIDLIEWDHVTYDVEDGECLHARKKFLDHMKRTYMRHDLKFVEKLRIVPFEEINSYAGNLSAEIDSFVFAAIKGGALKEIVIRVPTLKEPPYQDVFALNRFCNSFYMLPQIPLFASCRSLTSLYLTGCSFHEEFPNTNLPSVREVYIRNCIIPYNFVSKLINVCPKLEDLTVKFCIGVEVIRGSHSKLKKIILGCHDSKTVLEMDAPDLQTFKFGGAYWQSEEVKLKDDYFIKAPNLETICVRCATVLASTIRMSFTRFKNLKEVILSHCYMDKVPKFWGKKIERLVISNCDFGGGGLVLSESFVPVLRSLIIDSCDGLMWLIIDSTKLEELVLRKFTDLEAWKIYAPNAPVHSYVNLPN